jgi:hypothetical protein
LPRLLSIARTHVHINAPAKATEVPKLGEMRKMLKLSIWQINNAAMDESLANGFKNQLFRDMPERVEVLKTKLHDLVKKNKGSNKVNKLAKVSKSA